MSDKPLFQGMDEAERLYAPQQLPENDLERKRSQAEGDSTTSLDPNEPPTAAPVANVGTSPSGMAAPPNIGHTEHGGAPGDPNTDARDPLDSD